MSISEEVKTEVEYGFLEEALELARQVVALRIRLAAAKHQHAELLQKREASLAEGLDVLPDVRKLHAEIEALPDSISQIEQSARWIVEQGVERVNAHNRQQAAQQFMHARDTMRPVLEAFRAACVDLQAGMKQDAEQGIRFVTPYNVKLSEIQGLLNTGDLPRVSYRQLQFPQIDAELLGRRGLIAALDLWIGQLQ